MSDYGDCKECHRPMRSGRTRATQAPGTVVHDSSGYCQRCSRRLRRTGQLITSQSAKDHSTVNANIRTLAAYLEWRRPYRAKVMR